MAPSMRPKRAWWAATMAAAAIAGLALHHGAPAKAHRTGDTAATWDYTVVSVAGNIPPSAFVVQRDEAGPLITVKVDPTTTMARRFGGVSNLSELSAGDEVTITGTPQPDGSIAASKVQDISVQVGHSQINGSVLYAASDLGGVALKVTANEGSGAAFGNGSVITVATTPSTTLRLLNGRMGRVPDLRPGMIVTLYGLSDRAAQMVLSPHGLEQIAAAHAGALTRTAPDDGTAQ